MLYGQIPTQLSSLTNLQILCVLLSHITPCDVALLILCFRFLGDNQLSGPLTVDLSNAPLHNCDLGTNPFACPLPQWAATNCNAQCCMCNAILPPNSHQLHIYHTILVTVPSPDWHQFFATANCNTQVSGCNTCVSNKLCGWCADTSNCLEGNSFSPALYQCNHWYYKTCPWIKIKDLPPHDCKFTINHHKHTMCIIMNQMTIYQSALRNYVTIIYF